MLTYTEENYLKALFLLGNENSGVSVNDLSKRLGIKMPTVNSMIKKLADKNIVIYETYKPIRLTDKGKKEAALIIRKHRLTEMFMVGKMGFGWEEVHEIAEQIEHIQSSAFFEKMDELLGYPTIDPHGSPIPDKDGKIEWKDYIKMTDCKAGDTVKLVAVTHTTDEFLRFLNARGLKLEIILTIISIEIFDGSIVVSYGKRLNETLTHTVCERLLIEKV
jgi:DtxR family transcriptional regulator, Mn-dependent transcriptional regulator